MTNASTKLDKFRSRARHLVLLFTQNAALLYKNEIKKTTVLSSCIRTSLKAISEGSSMARSHLDVLNNKTKMFSPRRTVYPDPPRLPLLHIVTYALLMNKSLIITTPDRTTT